MLDNAVKVSQRTATVVTEMRWLEDLELSYEASRRDLYVGIDGHSLHGWSADV
jgi:hypothetical protein